MGTNMSNNNISYLTNLNIIKRHNKKNIVILIKLIIPL